MQLYPLKFKPIYKQRIWGGQKLREIFGKDIPATEKIGESWELADLPEDKSVVAEGELAGQAIGEIIAKYPKEIMGDKNFAGPFPLLIKFLDAEDLLSVQVHPDPQTCQRMRKGKPKTECWYVISAVPGAVIYKGLKEGVTKKDFVRAIKNGSVAELLAKIPVEAGQCHFLPAGTAHSVGPGILIAEIQTPSDTTYRIFDWNRIDEQTAKPRELHIEEALESIHYDVEGERLPVTTIGRLVDCKYFKTDKGRQVKDGERQLSAGRMRTLIIISGAGKFLGGGETSIEFKGGDVFLIPAAYEGKMSFAQDSEYLTVTI
jgi:mannose-6-phosphate isomerase